jgi:hypothetical protein
MPASLKKIAKVIYQNLELILWVVILILLFLPMPAEQHFTLCPLQNAGFENCPGCGLGRSANFALHGEIVNSLRMHPLGIFAIIVIIFRIFELLKLSFKPTK